MHLLPSHWRKNHGSTCHNSRIGSWNVPAKVYDKDSKPHQRPDQEELQCLGSIYIP